jgi:sugar/nucleoside kinase (ribokinase family)
MAELTAADVDDRLLATANHLHLSSPHLQPGIRDGLDDLFRRARAAGTSTSLDPGWDPAGDWGADDVLGLTDIFVPNAEEACRFAGVDDPGLALDRLAERCGTVVVKLGPEGAIARRGGETVRAEALAVEAVDATGAGDSFTAGLLAGLGRGQDLEQSLRLAIACGSLSTRALGGVDAQPTSEEAARAAAEVTARATESRPG